MVGNVRKAVLVSLALFYAVPLGTLLFLKMLSLSVILCSLYVVCEIGNRRLSLKSLQLFFFIFIILLWSVLVLHLNGAVDGGSRTLLSSILIGSTVVIILSHLVDNRFLRQSNIVAAFVYGVFCYSFFKGLLQLFPISLTDQVFTLLNISSSTSSSIGIGDSFRFNFSNDFFIPFAAYFTWRKPRLFSHRTLLFFLNVIFFVSVVLSFTRSIWILYILLFIYNFGVRGLLVLIGLFFLLLMLPVDLPFSELYAAMEMRIGVEGAASMDEKWYQVPVLIDEIEKYFFFGKGLGSYVESYVRSDALKYGYEVYFLVLFLHFGFLGMILISIVFTWSIIDALKSRVKILNYFALFFLFMSYGLTNPVIVSTLSIIFYFILLVFTSEINVRD